MQQLSVYAAQVKNQAQLNEAEKETSKEYRKEIKIVEHQRNALEKGLVNEEKEVATDELKYAQLKKKDRDDVHAEKVKEMAIRAALDKKLLEIRRHDQLVDQNDVAAQKAIDKKFYEIALKKALAKVTTLVEKKDLN